MFSGSIAVRLARCHTNVLNFIHIIIVEKILSGRLTARPAAVFQGRIEDEFFRGENR